MMPIVGVALVAALVAALGHFLRERMFNDSLRRDLTVVTASDQEIFAATDFA